MVQKETQIVVSNTSPIISLIKINKLEILKDLFTKVLITYEVYKEVTVHEQKTFLEKQISKGWIVRLPSPKLDIIHRLGTGEVSAIALALQYENSRLIVDDDEARNLAQSIGLIVTGTAGVLLFAKEKNIIKKVKPILDELRVLDRRVSNNLYNTVLKLAKE